METLIELYLKFWVFTVPFTVYLFYKLIPEILDLTLNSKKVSKLLEKSDNLDFNRLEAIHENNKSKQNSLNSSNLIELKRQVNYSNLLALPKNNKHEYGVVEH